MIFHPCHPGEVLKDYLGDLTVKEAAERLGVTRPNLSRILNGRAGISAEIGVRLAKAMPCTSPELWMKMQLNYDLWNILVFETAGKRRRDAKQNAIR
ncbi:MAG: HigA family addiction module antitoxin [Terriglobales bacterium]